MLFSDASAESKMILKDRIAIVTGGGRAIGREIARAFSAAGATVVIADMIEANAQQAALEIREAGGRSIGLKVDVREADQVRSMVRTALETYGKLDILVNNAAIAPTTPFLALSVEDWENTLRTNLTGAFLCAKAAVPAMLERGYGRIINIASVSGDRGQVGRAAYGVSKAGVIQLTKILAVELARSGILVNAISPGPILTEGILERVPVAARDAYSSLVPVGRFGTPAEVATMAVFLASDGCTFIAGHTINVDGGCAAFWPGGVGSSGLAPITSPNVGK